MFVALERFREDDGGEEVPCPEGAVDVAHKPSLSEHRRREGESLVAADQCQGRRKGGQPAAHRPGVRFVPLGMSPDVEADQGAVPFQRIDPAYVKRRVHERDSRAERRQRQAPGGKLEDLPLARLIVDAQEVRDLRDADEMTFQAGLDPGGELMSRDASFPFEILSAPGPPAALPRGEGAHADRGRHDSHGQGFPPSPHDPTQVAPVNIGSPIRIGNPGGGAYASNRDRSWANLRMVDPSSAP